jgi:hypothetical protein
MQRRRFKQTSSLTERLVEDTSHLQEKLASLPPGPERDAVVKRIRQNETASHLTEWLRSPGLRAPA